MAGCSKDSLRIIRRHPLTDISDGGHGHIRARKNALRKRITELEKLRDQFMMRYEAIENEIDRQTDMLEKCDGQML